MNEIDENEREKKKIANERDDIANAKVGVSKKGLGITRKFDLKDIKNKAKIFGVSTEGGKNAIIDLLLLAIDTYNKSNQISNINQYINTDITQTQSTQSHYFNEIILKNNSESDSEIEFNEDE